MPSEVNDASVAPGGPGSQTALRRENVRRVASTLAAEGPLTQAQLTRTTRLSAGTVASIIKDLESSGRVTLTPTTSSGRRALAIHLVDTGRVAVGIDIGRRHVRAIVATPTHDVLAEVTKELPVGHHADVGIAAACEVMDQALTRAERRHEQVLGAGVGIPGPIDPTTGRIGSGAILPEWVGLDIAHLLSQALHLPVYVDNDANLGAVAHLSWGAHADGQPQKKAGDLLPGKNFAFVKIGTGIGTGLVIEGHLFAGHNGLAGEIGHTVVVEQGSICRCGNRGCLETISSTAAMLKALSAVATPPASTDDLVRMALDGDVATRRVIEDAGFSIGRVLGQLASILNPETILIGGPLTPLGDILLDPIVRGLLRHTVPDIFDTTKVAMASLGDRAEALGAALCVLMQADPAELYGPLQNSF